MSWLNALDRGELLVTLLKTRAVDTDPDPHPQWSVARRRQERSSTEGRQDMDTLLFDGSGEAMHQRWRGEPWD